MFEHNQHTLAIVFTFFFISFLFLVQKFNHPLALLQVASQDDEDIWNILQAENDSNSRDPPPAYFCSPNLQYQSISFSFNHFVMLRHMEIWALIIENNFVL